MIKAPPTPKGFRDILPELAKKRREVINTIVGVLEESGFVPVETPTIEFAETLKGKYGEEEKLIYEFTDRGGRNLALRYDLTVPLARLVASNLNLIAKGPFRRYQIGQVFRGEKPQAGRWREFTQLDFDSVGSSDLSEDARIIKTTIKCLETLRINNFNILVNDRDTFKQLSERGFVKDEDLPQVIRIMDKLKKIGEKEVEDELEKNNFSKDILKNARLVDLSKVTQIYNIVGDKRLTISPDLARGLDYYTGMIFEVEIEGYGTSVAGGGRYDDLIGMFAKKQIPAVGGSFGIDRLIDALP